MTDSMAMDSAFSETFECVTSLYIRTSNVLSQIMTGLA